MLDVLLVRQDRRPGAARQHCPLGVLEPTVDLAARSDLADVHLALVAVDREDNPQASHAGSAACARSFKGFRVRPERVVANLVEARHDAPLGVPWQPLKVPLG